MQIKPAEKRPMGFRFFRKMPRFLPAKALPFSDIPSEMASHLERLTYSPEELVTSINNSLTLHDHDVCAGRSLLGRVIAPFSQPQDPDWIEIDGTRLVQLFELSKAEPPMTLAVSGIYRVEVAGLRTMLKSVDA